MQTWRQKNEKYSRLPEINWRFSLRHPFLWILLSVLVFVAQIRSYLITYLSMGRVKERGLIVWCLISKSLNNQIFDDAADKEQEAMRCCVAIFFMGCPEETNTAAKRVAKSCCSHLVA